MEEWPKERELEPTNLHDEVKEFPVTSNQSRDAIPGFSAQVRKILAKASLEVEHFEGEAQGILWINGNS